MLGITSEAPRIPRPHVDIYVDININIDRCSDVDIDIEKILQRRKRATQYFYKKCDVDTFSSSSPEHVFKCRLLFTMEFQCILTLPLSLWVLIQLFPTCVLLHLPREGVCIGYRLGKKFDRNGCTTFLKSIWIMLSSQITKPISEVNLLACNGKQVMDILTVCHWNSHINSR